jgi:cbb3-type cytochrome c oxidase subunit III
MSRTQSWIGFLATGLIFVTLGLVILREPALQTRAAEAQLVSAIREGIGVYIENCIVCHGASGEGLAAYAPLTTAAAMDATELTRVIERGRFATQMAAFGIDEGGNLGGAQVEALVALIQHGNWNAVYAQAADADRLPPAPIVAEVTDETIAEVSALPDGERLADGLVLFAEHCASCHGANLEGTTLAPALDTPELRTNESYELVRLIEQGVPGTLMAAWDNALTDPEADALAALLLRWPEVQAAGITMPVVEAEPIDMSPEAIARGDRLFDITCASCHGTDGYGTRMAPALNNALFLADTSDAQMRQIIAMGVSATIMPAWGGRLSDAQINDILAYLRSLEPNAPIIASPR